MKAGCSGSCNQGRAPCTMPGTCNVEDVPPVHIVFDPLAWCVALVLWAGAIGAGVVVASIVRYVAA